jgi:hypothetical protein
MDQRTFKTGNGIPAVCGTVGIIRKGVPCKAIPRGAKINLYRVDKMMQSKTHNRIIYIIDVYFNLSEENNFQLPLFFCSSLRTSKKDLPGEHPTRGIKMQGRRQHL